MTSEIENVTPTEPVEAKQVQQVEQVEQTSTEATTEQTQEQQGEQENKEKRTPWFEKRIAELTREKYEARRAAEEAKQEAERIRQALANPQQGQQEYKQQPADVNTLAEQRARQMLAEQQLNQSIDKVWQAGKSEFPNFDQAVSNLQLVGASREFVELAVSFDAGHKLIAHLGSDLDEAARILSLPPVHMARELTKLEMKLSQPQPKPVSKAPAPISPLGSSGTGEVDPARVSDGEWYERVYLKNRK